MWAVRILSGAQAGQVYPLKMGKNSIGRAPQCEIKIQSNGVSKEHAQIFLTDDKIILSDLNSRNGTFVNGVKIQNQRINLGDKVALKDIMFDLLKLPDVALLSQHQQSNRPSLNSQAPANWSGSAAPQFQNQMHQSMPDQMPHLDPYAGYAQSGPQAMMPAQKQTLGEIIQHLKIAFDNYIESVALPGIYQFAQSIEFRWVIGSMIVIYIFMVTLLSTVPMTATISHTIEAESMRRAVTIARALAQTNRQAVIDNLEVSVSTRTAEIEDGVSIAAIISAKDGHVIAPVNLRQQDSENSFFREARREGKEFHKSLGNSLVGASTPIISYDANRGEQSPVAYSVIIYDLSAVGVRTEQTFSLFVETFAIALIFGFFLYFVLMKIIEHPLVSLNMQLDAALREGRDDIQVDYKFPVLNQLVSNVGSALTRSLGGGGAETPQVNFQQRHNEALQLISMIDNPALAISAIDSKIISTNAAFEKLIGSNLVIVGHTVNELSDPALRQNIAALINSLRSQPEEKATSKIPFDGIDHTISGQAIFALNEPVYYIVSLHKDEGGH